MKSVFRLAARRTGVCAMIPELESAPVSEKRIGLNRVVGTMGVEWPRDHCPLVTEVR
jgi:hypothetical protein